VAVLLRLVLHASSSQESAYPCWHSGYTRCASCPAAHMLHLPGCTSAGVDNTAASQRTTPQLLISHPSASDSFSCSPPPFVAGAASTGGSTTGGSFVINSAAPTLVSGIKLGAVMSGTGLSRAAANVPLTGTTCTDGAATNIPCTGRSILDVSGTSTSAGVVSWLCCGSPGAVMCL
jgi:hypothetical protein